MKPDPRSPVFKVTGRDNLIVKAGTMFGGDTFGEDVPVVMPAGGLEIGADYSVISMRDQSLSAVKLLGVPDWDIMLGGFHFAPGGNAPARDGGDEIPAINPRSLWDRKFRPDGDPRGQALTQRFGLEFWGDIYLLGVDHHLNGTSKFGVTVADGKTPPVNPATGKKFKRFDYPTAVAVMQHHGKSLMSYDEFRAFMLGVTEKTSAGDDPEITGLDAPRTSQDGAMQGSGNMNVWGHDGDPDAPRPSFFGGSWWHDGDSGSRYAILGRWPGSSDEYIGARGRSDHLQLA